MQEHRDKTGHAYDYCVTEIGLPISEPSTADALDKPNNADRSKAFKKGITHMTEADYERFINQYTKIVGIYELNVGYKSGGHSTLIERKPDGTLVRIEQQIVGRAFTLKSLLKQLTPQPSGVRGVMRVDNTMFNAKYASAVKRVKK